MNIKSLLAACVLSIGLTVGLPANAAVDVSPTAHLSIKEMRLFSLNDVMDYWYTVSSDSDIYMSLLDKGVLGLMYYREYDQKTGSVYLGGKFDVLPHDFDAILYLTDNGDDISVHAVNNHDGSVTIYTPGAYLAP